MRLLQMIEKKSPTLPSKHCKERQSENSPALNKEATDYTQYGIPEQQVEVLVKYIYILLSLENTPVSYNLNELTEIYYDGYKGAEKSTWEIIQEEKKSSPFPSLIHRVEPATVTGFEERKEKKKKIRQIRKRSVLYALHDS